MRKDKGENLASMVLVINIVIALAALAGFVISIYSDLKVMKKYKCKLMKWSEGGKQK